MRRKIVEKYLFDLSLVAVLLPSILVARLFTFWCFPCVFLWLSSSHHFSSPCSSHRLRISRPKQNPVQRTQIPIRILSITIIKPLSIRMRMPIGQLPTRRTNQYSNKVAIFNWYIRFRIMHEPRIDIFNYSNGRRPYSMALNNGTRARGKQTTLWDRLTNSTINC